MIFSISKMSRVHLPHSWGKIYSVVFNRMWPKSPPAKEERDDFRLLGKTFGIALGKSPGKTRGKTFGE